MVDGNMRVLRVIFISTLSASLDQAHIIVGHSQPPRCRPLPAIHQIPPALSHSTTGVPTFNDDIEMTAVVTLAALLGAARIPRVPPLREQTFLFFGAGQVGVREHWGIEEG